MRSSSFLIVFMVGFAWSLSGQSYYSMFWQKPATSSGGTPMSKCDWVDATEEDGEEESDGSSMSNNSSDLELGNEGSTLQNFGMYFDSLNIPAGATIDSVYVQFTSDNDSTDDPCGVNIYCQEGSTPSTFDESDDDILDRDWTEAFVSWDCGDPEGWDPPGTAGADQRTPNFKTALQETIDHASYTQGDPIVVIVEGVQGEREAESFDGTAAPWICVWWTE